ncbi:hypothetical protein [Persicitalea jodogahamensis]|uniref:hypothetical protein n=1 Tax=Persicitalea jodogahamensis TaxID=402147 RepID=UPI001677BBC5|nr:hypothetical protein [Persicitalea jodogahamensis]
MKAFGPHRDFAFVPLYTHFVVEVLWHFLTIDRAGSTLTLKAAFFTKRQDLSKYHF